MKIAVMIMAAGKSRRFGECKLLTAVSQTENLLSRSIQQTSQSEVGPVFVITGRWHQEIKLAQQQGQVPIVPLIYCPNGHKVWGVYCLWRSSTGTGLRCCFDYVGRPSRTAK
ncbi:NTP transferase domain-containing protein [Vibrio fluvialis]|uniref:NTP transferase domain-containing protein n=1 Tax=Vibrio fluvialis TaxID=676 RepID=UPI001E2CE9B7|nr:NTP transferase domain-containing protein [Vibrio fluvialis]